MKKLENNINSALQLLIFALPILMIIGSFSVNSFAIIFSLYGLVNYKFLIKNNIINKRVLLIFFFLVF